MSELPEGYTVKAQFRRFIEAEYGVRPDDPSDAFFLLSFGDVDTPVTTIAVDQQDAREIVVGLLRVMAMSGCEKSTEVLQQHFTRNPHE